MFKRIYHLPLYEWCIWAKCSLCHVNFQACQIRWSATYRKRKEDSILIPNFSDSIALAEDFCALPLLDAGVQVAYTGAKYS